MPPPPQAMMAPPPMPAFVGPADKTPLLDEWTAATLSNLKSLTILQKVSMLEAVTQGLAEVANKYTIHPGNHDKAWEGPVIMNAMEKSDFWLRYVKIGNCPTRFQLFTNYRIQLFVAVTAASCMMCPGNLWLRKAH
eukprot:jgi/Mesvir1/28395/Mv05840-RA.1